MIFKKISAIVISLLILLSSVPVFAYELPHAFWALADSYQTALDNNDNNSIISVGGKIVSLLEHEEKNEQVNTILASKLYDMGYAYEEIGGMENHVKAGECFEKYIPYGEGLNWTDGVKIAKQKAIQFKPELKLYTPTTETQSYFGAKNEPEKGVLYGEVGEHYRNSESMILLYLEYGGSTDFTWPNHIFSKAHQSGKAVELALNFPGEGSQLTSIINDTKYLDHLILLLRAYSDVPVFLRIGAEVNIWNDKADSNLYIQAFRKIASATRDVCDNVAIVWSILHTSEWSVNYNDYYPGDDYVDWVGISAYANRYFGAKEWSPNDSHNPIVYKSGDAADPVLMIHEIVEEYGDRKPIMLTECGSAYYTKGEINKFSTLWAVTSLKRMYSMIPIVYPQVKLIAYFNNNMANEYNYYDLEGCAELKAAYNEIITSPWFIQNKASNTVENSYKFIENTIAINGNSLKLYAYPHLYGDDLPKVNYYLNGEWLTSAVDLPYYRDIDLSSYQNGNYILTAEVESYGYVPIRRDYTLIKSGNANELSDLTAYQTKALEYCKSAGVISGYEDGTIKPYNCITRAEFATMTARLCGLSSDTPCSFNDAYDSWATTYIDACVQANAIAGVGDNKFEPDKNVTFEQAVKILTSSSGLTNGYDLESLGGYPHAYLAIGEEFGLYNGLSSTDNRHQINRIDATVLFYNSQL